MTGLWITLGILACLAFLLWMPVTLHFTYEESLSIKLGYLFLRFQLLPRKPKKKESGKTALQEEKSGGRSKETRGEKEGPFSYHYGGDQGLRYGAGRKRCEKLLFTTCSFVPQLSERTPTKPPWAIAGSAVLSLG